MLGLMGEAYIISHVVACVAAFRSWLYIFSIQFIISLHILASISVVDVTFFFSSLQVLLGLICLFVWSPKLRLSSYGVSFPGIRLGL